jgi:predicted dehydrogenase
MAIKTCLMIGAGGMAGGWIHMFVNAFSDRIKIIGLVDVNKEMLQRQGQALGLSEDKLFTDYKEAVENVKADFCGIATPPQFHSPQAVAAMDHGMPVICEKPIADKLDAAKEMIRTSQRTGLPCAIIQNYRYAPNKQELVRIREEGRLGKLQHILGRYACDYRKYGTWGGWRHDMDFGLLFEGSVHHLDMLRFLSGGDCKTLIGFGWNPDWSSFKHFSSGMYLMQMNNGIHTFYEGNSTATGILNCWHGEYYRAEFENGTVEISHGSEMRIHRAGQDVEVYEAPSMNLFGHDYLFAEFLDWLDSKQPSVTRIEDNIKSFAMVIAAVETTVDGQPKQIADYLCDLDL